MDQSPTEVGAVSAEVALIVDRLQIVDVINRVAAALDDRDWALLRTCFVADAVETFSTGRAEGYDAIESVCATALGQLDATQHLVSNTRVEVAGDEASARSYFQAQHVRRATEGGDTFTIGGTYEDRLLRVGGEWRIAGRSLLRTWTAGNPSVLNEA
jgi:3-phenylpropionate/cinnamic acid dioxygenase small subunit